MSDDEKRDAEIGRLMASISRMDDADEDEVDPEEYERLLARLVYLRHERDEKKL